MDKIQKRLTQILACGILSLSILTPNGYAQSSNLPVNYGLGKVQNNQNITVNPASASDSLATPFYETSFKTCFRMFWWEKYMADYNDYTKRRDAAIAKGEKDPGFNSNPYINLGCTAPDAVASNGERTISADGLRFDYTNNGTSSVKAGKDMYKNLRGYSNFTTKKDSNGATVDRTLTDAILATFSADPNVQTLAAQTAANLNNPTIKSFLDNKRVGGLFPNGSNGAQGLDTFSINGQLVTKGSNVDRTQVANMNTIYSEQELNRIYGPQTARTGAPRLVSTGPDQMKAGTNEYLGGKCYTENGKMITRKKLNVGTPDEINTPASFGNPNNAVLTCRELESTESGELSLDQPMRVYQFAYLYMYPNAEQCRTLMGFPTSMYESGCLAYYRDRLSKSLTGKADGKGLFYTFNYYGMFADSSFRCQKPGQTNCDTVPRWSADGNWKSPDLGGPRSQYVTNASEAELRKFYPQFTNAPASDLKNYYEGFIRRLDGYNIYLVQ
jgi:hypothetical protein